MVVVRSYKGGEAALFFIPTPINLSDAQCDDQLQLPYRQSAQRVRRSCLILDFNGAILSSGWKETLWVRFCTAAPQSLPSGLTRGTEPVRRAIQNSEESLRALSARYGINQITVAKWRKRTSVADVPTGPKDAKSIVLSVEDEAMIPDQVRDGVSQAYAAATG